MTTTPSRVHFHPQRVFPRRARLMMGLAQVPGMAEALIRYAPGLALERTRIASEDPAEGDLQATSLVVCGVPRSGTTFLASAAKTFLGGQGRVWKSHDPFVVGDFVPLGVPVVITLRPPLDTAVSKAIYHNDPVSPTSLVRRLALTTAWHRLMARQARHELVRAWNFTDVIADPERVLQSTLHRSASVPLNVKAVVSDVGEIDTQHRQSMQQTHIPHQGRHLLRARFEEFADDRRVRRYLALALEAQERVRRNHTP